MKVTITGTITGTVTAGLGHDTAVGVRGTMVTMAVIGCPIYNGCSG